MTLLFEEEGSLKLSLPCEELAVKVIEMALDYAKCRMRQSESAFDNE